MNENAPEISNEPAGERADALPDERARTFRHALLPAPVGLALVSLYGVPVGWFDCANRGWIAVALIVLSMIGAIVSMALAMRAVPAALRGRAEPAQRRTALLWLLTAGVFLAPSLVVALYEVGLRAR
jgi:hypothetical protein